MAEHPAARRPQLHALADQLGIEASHRSPLEGAPVEVSAETLEALIAAMGFDASSESAAARGLAEWQDRRLPPPLEPEPAPDVESLLGGAPGFGFWANVYTLRSARDAGFGTLAELGQLVRLAADAGATFVGINPLHALASADGEASPYFPESRFHRSPLYLDLASVPEAAAAPPGEVGTDAARIDPAARQRWLDEQLPSLHQRFRTAAGDVAEARRRAFETWRATEGEALESYATFAALAEHQGGARDWRRWPESHRRSDAPAVAEFRRERRDAVERHEWIQFELDRQLGRVAELARDVGLPRGLCADLALGSAPGGADPWCWPGLFAAGAHLGAPPDAFSREGQDWGLAPVDPHALRADGYELLRRLLDANVRHAGALRIDHAIGMRRLFWIPEGASPRDGAYVRQPEADLFAELVRASRRHGVVVVAEDLGNVPEGFSEELQRRGMLSTRVLLFERDGEGFRAAEEYPRRCLATLTTHDLPPLAAWLSDADLPLRRRAGQIPDDRSLERMAAERAEERAALARRLSGDGLLPAENADLADWAEATTRFLARSPAAWIAISLDDLTGETEPINLPGVSASRHASWRRRSSVPLEGLFGSPLARRVLDALEPRRAGAVAVRPAPDDSGDGL